MRLNDKAKALLRTFVPLFLGVGLFWLLYRKTDFEAIRQVIYSEVNYPILLASLLWGAMANIVRGYRWKLLVDPIVDDGERPRLLNSVLTVLGSYTVNMGIPRAGELWRCAEFKRYETLSFSALLGTLITDRLMDVFVLLVILAVVILTNLGFFVDFFEANTSALHGLRSILGSVWLYIFIAVSLAAVLYILLHIRRRPDGRIALSLKTVLRGLGSIRAMEQRKLFLFYTLLIWLGYFGFFYTTFYAFSFTQSLSLGVGIIAFTMSVMTVVAPVQAGLGPWHFMVITTLVAFGVSRTDASAFALIVHTTQTLWITLVGLVAILILPLVNRHYKRRLYADITATPHNTSNN
ncbi:lysylphosphatidylglycerol synthase transmembrane domain-containing protein [Porphyromonas sp. COT-239 OH1446]|uniref:lysylphosphatidylglycerol synthase transmembrane domain-containing protein n=1 Tax=Porphyromonas sp. COT-239 OH1446 TaxID=1515613 RepID=UPI000690D6FB|nr:lysylphosphatidylglycerol synthase transmembrane domain-containing protein [Porphyromonas sp. COT-239 OH1446]